MSTKRRRRQRQRTAEAIKAGPARPGAVGRAVLFVHLLLSPIIFSWHTAEAFEFVKVAWLVLSAIGLGALMVSGEWSRMRPPRDLISLGVWLFLVSAAVSTATSISPLTSLRGAHESFSGLVTVAAYGVLFFATRRFCQTAEDARRLLLAPVIGATVAVAYALTQMAPLQASYQRLASVGQFVRPWGTLGHPNHLAAYLVMTLPVIVYFLARALARRQRWVAGVLAITTTLATFAIVVSLSRGAWLALAGVVGGLIVGAWMLGARPHRAILGGAGVVAGGAALLVALGLSGRGGALLMNVAERLRLLMDSPSRQHLWRTGWELFRDSPLVGVGLDAFQLAFPAKRAAAYMALEWVTPVKVHNEALQVLATQGLLGGLAIAVLTAGLVVAGVRLLRRPPTTDRFLVLALGAPVIGFYLQDVFSFTVAACGTLFVTLAALLSRAAQSPGWDDEIPGDRIELFALALAIGVALTLGVVVLDVLDRPAELLRVVGLVTIVGALIAASSAAFALAQHGRPPIFSDLGRRRPSDARGATSSVMHRAAAVSAWVGAAVLCWLVVVRPVAASREAKLADRDPRRAFEHVDRAITLDPLNEMYWVWVGRAALAEARQARGRDKGMRASRARQAFERAARLVPANALTHVETGSVLAELARDGVARPEEVFAAFDRGLRMDPNNGVFYVDAARAALLIGDNERARNYAARGAALYPKFGPPRSVLGFVAIAENRNEEAVRLLTEAVAADWWYDPAGLSAVTYASLAQTYLRLGRPTPALEAARLSLALAPSYANARFMVAKALELLGRRDEAIAEYRRLLGQQPDHELARDALRVLGVPGRAYDRPS